MGREWRRESYITLADKLLPFSLGVTSLAGRKARCVVIGGRVRKALMVTVSRLTLQHPTSFH